MPSPTKAVILIVRMKPGCRESWRDRRAQDGRGVRTAAGGLAVPAVIRENRYSFAAGPAEGGGLSLQKVERRHIARAPAPGNGHPANAAAVLQGNRTTLCHKIIKFGPIH